jgi:hypothetical protein
MCMVRVGVLEDTAIDLGGMVDAIFVASSGHLGFDRIILHGPGPPSTRRLDTHARYKTLSFGPWPSITLAPNASVRPSTNRGAYLWGAR